MSSFVYLVGGSHDCIKMSFSEDPPEVIEMMKRMQPEIGRYMGTADRPVLAIIERYRYFVTTGDGSLIYENIK